VIIPLRNPKLRLAIMREVYEHLDQGEEIPEKLKMQIRSLPDADWREVTLELLRWLGE
jgi:hypothetical protein